MTFKELKYLVCSDLYRYYGRFSLGLLVRELVWGCGFRYTFWMRVCSCLRHKSALWFVPYIVARLFLRHYVFKLGIGISFEARIGPGFYIGHFGAIFVNDGVTIGRNCNISQCVTIGAANRGERKGQPALGDHVYIGPGAKIFGAIRVGNNVAIGANCVVNKDVPDNAVVVGVPARVVSYRGTEGYIENTDYDGRI